MNWLYYSFLTVLCFGLYGIFLHSGQMGMADPVSGRYKAFLFVGVAYFIIAVLAPLLLLKSQGASFSFPMKGIWLSLMAGSLGAVGAFGILLAFGAKGTPAAVMSIVFAGAPIVNAVVAIVLHPPKGGVFAVPWQFVLGILMAAAGGYLVVTFKPPPAAAMAQTAFTAPIASADTPSK